jgi:hypothetical protein
MQFIGAQMQERHGLREVGRGERAMAVTLNLS